MKTIGQNEELFNYMASKKLYLIDSVLFKIEIFEEEYMPSIELNFKLSRNEKFLKIKFTTIIEYGFYYKNDLSFYNVERCKFFKKDDVFYLSLDPYDEVEELNQKDQDFILCKGIEGYME